MKVFSELKGSIVRVEADHVWVSFGMTDIRIPKEKLSSPDLARYGAPVFYRVLSEDGEDVKFDRVDPREPELDHEVLRQVEALLSVVPGEGKDDGAV